MGRGKGRVTKGLLVGNLQEKGPVTKREEGV